MFEENTEHLRNEIKEFISTANHLINKVQRHNNEVQIKELSIFANKIQKLNLFAVELLNLPNIDESVVYNARMIKNITETPIYDSKKGSISCSMLSAAEGLIKNNESSSIKYIMGNLIKDEIASEVLFDDLMVIYKDLAA